jgi:hypothetical protein
MAVDTIMKSRDATFFEDEFPMKNSTPSMSGHDSISIPGSIPILESTKPVIHADVEPIKKFLRRIIIQSLERVRDRGL